MTTSLSFKPALLLAALLSVIAPAQAAFSIFGDATSFRSATTAPGVDNFFGVPQDQAALNPMNRRTLLGETYRYQASATESSLIGAGTADEIWLTANVAADVITFSHFSPNVTAFGGYFFGTDFNGQYQSGDVTLVVTDASGLTVGQTLTGPTLDSFVGFVSSGPAIVSVSLYAQALPSGDALWPTARAVMLAQVAPGALLQTVSSVPEPASAALMLAGLTGLAMLARRRR